MSCQQLHDARSVFSQKRSWMVLVDGMGCKVALEGKKSKEVCVHGFPLLKQHELQCKLPHNLQCWACPSVVPSPSRREHEQVSGGLASGSTQGHSQPLSQRSEMGKIRGSWLAVLSPLCRHCIRAFWLLNSPSINKQQVRVHTSPTVSSSSLFMFWRACEPLFHSSYPWESWCCGGNM